MTTRAGLTLLLSLCLLAPPARTGTLHVPAEVASLQQAIDQSAPGDVIVVHGGQWADLVIDKPLTIVAPFFAPAFVEVSSSHPGLGGCDPVAAVTLDGPGSGTVTLSGLFILCGEMGPLVCNPYAGVLGGGFDELRLIDTDVWAGEWGPVSGLAQGADAVHVDVGHVVVDRGWLRARAGADDGSGLAGLTLPTAGRGLVTTGDATILRGTVDGGPGITATLDDPLLCPPSAASFSGGEGGDALAVAGTVWRDDGTTTLRGGTGSVITCPVGGQTYVMADGGVGPTGALVTLPGELALNGPLVMGLPWQASWVATGPLSYLAVGLPMPPQQVGGKGPLFVDPAGLLLFAVPGSGLINVPYLVPTDSALLGLSLAIQVYDPQLQRLTNPVLGTLVPQS